MIIQSISNLIIVYASQEGNAKAIAEDLQQNCSSHGLNATLHCISDLLKNEDLLLSQNHAIFIASTTGK